MKRNLFEQLILYDYRYIIAHMALVLVALYVLFWQLGGLLPGFNEYEARAITATTWEEIWSNPLYWPHKILTLISLNFLPNFIEDSAVVARLPSVLIAAVGLVVFYVMIRHRFRARIAIAALALLATSSWWLSAARLAAPDILAPVTILALMVVTRCLYEQPKSHWLLLTTLLLLVGLYIPYVPWLIAAGALITRPLIKQTWRQLPLWSRTLATLLLLAGLVPLIIAAVGDTSILHQLFGWPPSWPTPLELLNNVTTTVGELFWASPAAWGIRLGTLPLLDLFTAVMVALGLYHLDRDISRSLAQFVITGLSLLIVLISLNPGPLNTIILIPFIFTLAASGIVMLLAQWYDIFPRNPIARMTAFIPTAVLLMGVMLYHHQRYFVAWPRTPETVEQFSEASRYILNRFNPNLAETIVLVSTNEEPYARMFERYDQRLIATDVASAVINQDNYVITQAAYRELAPSEKQEVRRAAKPVNNASAAESSVLLWVKGVDTLQ